MTTVQNGFDNGSYQSSASLAGTANGFTWPTVNANGIHTWRVMTRYGSQWVPSVAAEFTGPVCVGDIANPGG